MKKRVQAVILSVAILGGLMVNDALAKEELVLVKDGKPCSSIVIAKDACKAAQFAAFELQRHFQEITGAVVPIVRDGEKAEGVPVYVGESEAAKAAGMPESPFKYQEYSVIFKPGALGLMGFDKKDAGQVKYGTDDPNEICTWPGFYDEQGTLYAAYDFLEKFCGVRWLNPTEFGMICPKNPTLTVSGESFRMVPTLINRNAYADYPPASLYDASSVMWRPDTDEYKQYLAAAYPQLRQKYTEQGRFDFARGRMDRLFLLRMRAGGEKCGCNHSMYSYYQRYLKLPGKEPDKLFKENKPEIFAKGYAEGTEPPQMCYSSKELVRLVAEQAKDYFEKGGYTEQASMESLGYQWGENYFAVEPMDNSSFCKCPDCQKWVGEYKNGGSIYSSGKFSAYKFNFVNEVAKLVAKTNPDKKIISLAYGSTLARPENLKLEPNVVVDFCFDANRLVYDTASYEYEIKCLKDWVKNEPGRPFYLWLYNTFPNEIANNGKWYAFPGFFAHKIDEQMKLFKELGIKGIFHCGYGQDVESYVSYKLMFDASQNLETLLDEYFRMYGPAAKPMKQLYLEIEETYCNPNNYPEVGGKPYAGHQSKIVAWDYLGTEARMKRFGSLMDEARAAVAGADEVYKKRLELFDRAVWSYMVAGRENFLKYKTSPIPAVAAPRVADAGGDFSKVDWAKAAPMGDKWFDRGGDKPSKRKFDGRICHDGAYLYLELVDNCDTSKLNASPMVFCYDDWEVFVAAQRAEPFRQYAFGPTGLTVALSHGEVNWRKNVAVDGKGGMKVASDTSAKDKWIGRAAWPLKEVLPGGAEPGKNIYMNVIRVSSPAISGAGIGIDTWVSFCTVHDVDRLAEIKLEK